MAGINAGVIGASGYSGSELLRLLLRHPEVTITRLTSRQYAGTKLEETAPRFTGTDLTFREPDPEDIARQCDVAFLALPHGVAADYAAPLLDLGVKAIDISADFRLRDPAVYQQYYGREHPAPDKLPNAVYALPEYYREDLRQTQLAACPGCYPTSVILALAPLLEHGLISPGRITVNCLSGVTGAGRKVDVPFLFAECNESMRAYSVTGHRHVPEMEQELSLAADAPVTVSFIPHLVPVNRGILCTVVIDPAENADAQTVRKTVASRYSQEPFIRILPDGKTPDTKDVTMSNVAELGYACDARTGTLVAASAIDNLTKGASGQAVQAMNLMFGLEETTGLHQ